METEGDKNKGFFSRLGKKTTKKVAAKATSKVKKVETEQAKKARMDAYKLKLAKNKARVAQERAKKAESKLKAMKPSSMGKTAYRPGGSAGVGPAVKAKAPKIIATHRVKKGDTLGQIAKQYYGSGAAPYYKLIQSANPDLIKDVNLIYPGQVFKIPELPEDLKKK
jgi:nucleoid-associated protein YgaU